MRIDAIILFLIFGLAALCCGQDPGPSLDLLDYRTDVRAQGIGGAGVSMERHLEGAAFGNPALAATLKGPCGAGFVCPSFSDTLFVGASLGNGSWLRGVGGAAGWIMQLPTDTASNRQIGNTFFGSTGFSIGPWLYLGAGAKALVLTTKGTSSWGMGVDVGMFSALFGSRLRLGFAYKDVVPLVLEQGVAKAERNPKMAAGASYVFFYDRIAVYAEFDQTLTDTSQTQVLAGGECRLSDPVTVRIGWNDDIISIGTRVMLGSLSVDYALLMLPGCDLERPHRVSVSWYWGEGSRSL